MLDVVDCCLPLVLGGYLEGIDSQPRFHCLHVNLVSCCIQQAQLLKALLTYYASGMVLHLGIVRCVKIQFACGTGCSYIALQCTE